MTSTDRKQSRSEFLGPPPLLKNDNEEHYKALQEQVKEYIGPVDFLGDLAVREITDAIWEGQRYKKCQSALIDSAFHEALIQALTRIHQNADWLARNQADQWFRGTSEERSAVGELLEQFGISIDMLYADAAALNATPIAIFERMIGNRKSSRSKMIRDRHQFMRELFEPLPGSIR